MSIGHTPDVTIHGAHETLINARLISWEHIDASGMQSDRLTLTVDTHDVEGLPQEGERLSLHVGYRESEIIDKGEFIIATIDRQLFPPQIVIHATAAPFQRNDGTGFRERRSASYGPITLGNLFRQLASRHGLSPRIEASLDSVMLDHIDQNDETDMAFLTRLAGRYDAVTKPWDGRYVMAYRGNVKTLSGEEMPVLTYSIPKDARPGDHAFVNASVSYDSRHAYKGCKASWWDDCEAKMKTVTLGQAPFKALPHTYKDEDSAKAATGAGLRKTLRTASALSLEVPGNPLLAAEGIILLDDTWPADMQGKWSITTVTASHSAGSGYRCRVEATLPAA